MNNPSYSVGPYNITPLVMSHFRLDGGSMFGSVPKNLWNKKIQADSDNCIPLVARSLYIEYEDKKILVDTDLGTNWSEKEIEIFAIKNVDEKLLPFDAAEITDLIITHLHFDHAGGISYLDEHGELKPRYPQATYHVQHANIETAKNPLIKERASYKEHVINILDNVPVNVLHGDGEIFPGLHVQVFNGHTRGQQAVLIRDKSQTIAFPSDLIPTSHHIKLPYCMGYDMCSETILKEKESFLESAKQEKWQIIFQHDAEQVMLKF